jgi:hypothetical protein
MKKVVFFTTLLLASTAYAQDVITNVPLHFHPVEPCRIIDSRVKSPTQNVCPDPNFPDICFRGIGEGALQTYLAAGDSSRESYRNRTLGPWIEHNFAYQGGALDGCDIPRKAKAVQMNVTVLPGTRKIGHLTVWPYEIIDPDVFGLKPAPVASTINWGPNTVVTSNSTTIPICDPELLEDCNMDFVVQPVGSWVDVVIDVTGYFSSQSHDD